MKGRKLDINLFGVFEISINGKWLIDTFLRVNRGPLFDRKAASLNRVAKTGHSRGEMESILETLKYKGKEVAAL